MRVWIHLILVWLDAVLYSWCDCSRKCKQWVFDSTQQLCVNWVPMMEDCTRKDAVFFLSWFQWSSESKLFMILYILLLLSGKHFQIEKKLFGFCFWNPVFLDLYLPWRKSIKRMGENSHFIGQLMYGSLINMIYKQKVMNFSKELAGERVLMPDAWIYTGKLPQNRQIHTLEYLQNKILVDSRN